MRPTLLLPLAILASSSALAQDAAQPAAYQAVLDCQRITDASARLACFDAAVASFATATASNDVIVVAKEEVERRERERFGGRATPALTSADGEALDVLDTTLSSFQTTRFGKLIITLPSGAVWEQLDSRQFRRDPVVGAPVQLRKGTLGRYTVTIGDERSITMQRIDRRR